jgi:hypothetical protein
MGVFMNRENHLRQKRKEERRESALNLNLNLNFNFNFNHRLNLEFERHWKSQQLSPLNVTFIHILIFALKAHNNTHAFTFNAKYRFTRVTQSLKSVFSLSLKQKKRDAKERESPNQKLLKENNN